MTEHTQTGDFQNEAKWQQPGCVYRVVVDSHLTADTFEMLLLNYPAKEDLLPEAEGDLPFLESFRFLVERASWPAEMPREARELELTVRGLKGQSLGRIHITREYLQLNPGVGAVT